MSPVALSTLLSAALVFSGVVAQDLVPTPLVNVQFPFGSQPEQAEPTGGPRGNQVGYNICNSTTQNQQSECQTLMINSIQDFCLWAPPTPNSTISDTEGVEVAWCTTPNWGTRVMYEGTILGLQWTVTPNYIVISAVIDQTLLYMTPDDYGGELDPHGQDLGGNPLGGMVYSNAYPLGNTDLNNYTQIVEWNEFIGNGEVCFKACPPDQTNAEILGYCQNIYDELGISYNCGTNPVNGTFEVCLGDAMEYPVGTYVVDGVTSTYTQPATGAITSMPYTPVAPATSSCTTYQSTDLWPHMLPTGSSASSSTAAPTSGSTGASGPAPSATGGASGDSSSGAASMQVPLALGVAGVMWATLFLS